MNSSTYRLILLMIAWGCAASLAGYFQLLAHLPPGVVPLLIAGLTVSFSVALRRVASFRATIAMLGVRGQVAPHLVRFIGVAFLWLHAQGRLPAEFAYRAGWGDIATAAGAVALLAWPDGVGFRRALFAWNIFGALDLFVAVGTGGWLNVVRPGSMIEIARFPLTLVPLWLVPVMLSGHLLMLQGRPSPAIRVQGFPVKTPGGVRRNVIGTET
jgi:hypothetical protein